MPQNFAVLGVGGFVAPRHLKAIADTGNRLVAAADPNDSVGVLDRHGFDVAFFRDVAGLRKHLEGRRRGPEAGRVHWLSVCTPNDLHAAHCLLGLESGADVICEKPLVLDPAQLASLEKAERATGRRIATVLQLRMHPKLLELARSLAADPRPREVSLTYVTARGPWYAASWKGDEARSGGIAANIGVHFFDLLLWLFGAAAECRVQLSDGRRMAGYLELARARLTWFLSVDPSDLPFEAVPGGRASYRSITIDGKEVEFSEGFTDLHTRVYEETLAGRGFGLTVVRPSVELVDRIRRAPVSPGGPAMHPLLAAPGPR
jgi:UDP-N-acetyl-2-amino-2-deoxyglucuronate dehydrogenase